MLLIAKPNSWFSISDAHLSLLRKGWEQDWTTVFSVSFLRFHRLLATQRLCQCCLVSVRNPRLQTNSLPIGSAFRRFVRNSTRRSLCGLALSWFKASLASDPGKHAEEGSTLRVPFEELIFSGTRLPWWTKGVWLRRGDTYSFWPFSKLDWLSVGQR